MEAKPSTSSATIVPISTSTVPLNENSPYVFRAIQWNPIHWNGANFVSLEASGTRKILRPTRRFRRTIVVRKLGNLRIIKPKVCTFSKDDMYIDGPMGRNRTSPIRFRSLNPPVDELNIVDDLNREIQQLELDDGDMNQWFNNYRYQQVPDGRHAPTADLFRPRTKLNDDLYKDLSNECSEASSPIGEPEDDDESSLDETADQGANWNAPESGIQMEALDLCHPTPKFMKFSRAE